MKTKLKIFICLALVLLTSFSAVPIVSAEEAIEATKSETYHIGDYIFELTSDSTVKILYYVGKDTKPIIPAFLGDHPITGIGKWAFYGTKVEEIEIPEGIKYIEEEAFYSCSKLKTVILPKSLESIGNAVFRYCHNLEKVTFNTPDTQFIKLGDYAFYGCHALKSVNLPKNLTEIPEGTFAYCTSLEDVTLPEGIQRISEYAFYYSGLFSITLNKDVNYIGKYAFAYSGNLETINALGETCNTVYKDAFLGCLADNPFEEEATPPDYDTITVYFVNNIRWDHVFIYYWGTEHDHPYPGIPMTLAETNENGDDIYSIAIPADAEGLIFNSGRNYMAQTNEITENIYDGVAFYCTEKENGVGHWNVDSYIHLSEKLITIYFKALGDWGPVSVYGFSGNEGEGVESEYFGPYPGKEMTYVNTNEEGEKIYRADIPADIDFIKFVDLYNENRRTENIPNSRLFNNTVFYPEKIDSNNRWTVNSYDFSYANPPKIEYYTIFFSNNKGWDNVYFYGFYGEEGNAKAIYPNYYPGAEMTYVRDNRYGEKIYSCKVPADIDYVKFSDGSSDNNRTVNISNSELGNNKGFYLGEKTNPNRYSIISYDYSESEIDIPGIELPTYNAIPPTGYNLKGTEDLKEHEDNVSGYVNNAVNNDPNRDLNGLQGDADDDGILNVRDATCVQKHVAGIEVIEDDIRYKLADMDYNGKLSVKDATLIQKLIVGKDIYQHIKI